MESNFINFLLVYGIALTIFLIIDMIWLLKIAKSFYKEQLKTRWNKNPNKVVALVFYALFVVGLVYFAVYPSLTTEDFHQAVYNGALFGFFTYITYDLTNLCVLKNWPKKMTIVDIIWGTILSLVVSTSTYLIVETILL